VAQGSGCPADRVDSYEAMINALDEVVPRLTDRTEPLVLEIAAIPEATFEP
jgi:benzoylformate decarboxylase